MMWVAAILSRPLSEALIWDSSFELAYNRLRDLAKSTPLVDGRIALEL